jgi:hypothetical protein
MSSTRKNLLLVGDDFTLTILKPQQASWDGKVFCLYEDAYGDVDLKIMTPDALKSNFECDMSGIDDFIGGVDPNIEV